MVLEEYTTEEILAKHYPQMQSLAAKLIPGARCVVASHILRSSNVGQTGKDGVRPTATFIHNDFSEGFRDQLQEKLEEGSMINKLSEHGISPEDMKKATRLRMLSFWQNIAPTPVKRRPFSVVDASTVRKEDISIYEYHPHGLVQTAWDMPLPVMITFVCPHPDQRWYYYSDVKKGEVMVLKQYDSASPPPGNGVGMHVAFDDPTTTEDAPDRQSLETRVFCIEGLASS